MKTRSLLLATLIAAIPVLAAAQQAPQTATVIEKEKGAVTIGEAVELQGVITAIDKNTREVTIKGGSGNTMTVTAGPQVKNFKQIKVGDLVTLSYVAALGLELKKAAAGCASASNRSRPLPPSPVKSRAPARAGRSRSSPTSRRSMPRPARSPCAARSAASTWSSRTRSCSRTSGSVTRFSRPSRKRPSFPSPRRRPRHPNLHPPAPAAQ